MALTWGIVLPIGYYYKSVIPWIMSIKLYFIIWCMQYQAKAIKFGSVEDDEGLKEVYTITSQQLQDACMGYFLMGFGIAITVVVHLSVITNWQLKSFSFLTNIIMAYVYIGETSNWYVQLMIFVETLFIMAYYYVTTIKSYKFYEQQYLYQNKINVVEAIPVSVCVLKLNKEPENLELVFRNTHAKNDERIGNDCYFFKLLNSTTSQQQLASNKSIKDRAARSISDEIRDILRHPNQLENSL